MKTFLFLTVLLLTSCELQYQKQLHKYSTSLYRMDGSVFGTGFQHYDLVERNKHFLVFHSYFWDTLYLDAHNSVHGRFNSLAGWQNEKHDYKGIIIKDFYKSLQMKGEYYNVNTGEKMGTWEIN
jgi:hypothetical protein